MNKNSILYSLLIVYYQIYQECTGSRFAKIVEFSQRAIQIGKVVIRRTAYKYLTSFITGLKIVYCPIRNNLFISNSKVLDIKIGSINIHICTNHFKYYINCMMIFLEFMASNSLHKTLQQLTKCTLLWLVQCQSYFINKCLELVSMHNCSININVTQHMSPQNI